MQIHKTKILPPASLKSIYTQERKSTQVDQGHTKKPTLHLPTRTLATPPPSQKYLYYEAHSGFNDILSAILRLITYCKKYNRVLLINMINSTYRINFADYFTLPDDKDIITDTNVIKEICLNITSIYPHYFAPYIKEILKGSYKSKLKEIKLEDLPNENRAETLIVHCHGKIGDGFQLFKQMK